MKVLVGAFYQEKTLLGAFSVIVKTDCETDGSSAALILLLGSLVHNLAGGEARCRWSRAKFCVVAQFHFSSSVSIKSCEVHLHILKTIGKRKHESNTC